MTTSTGISKRVRDYFGTDDVFVAEVFVRHEDREGGSWTANFYAGRKLTTSLVRQMRRDSVRVAALKTSADHSVGKNGRVADFSVDELLAKTGLAG